MSKSKEQGSDFFFEKKDFYRDGSFLNIDREEYMKERKIFSFPN